MAKILVGIPVQKREGNRELNKCLDHIYAFNTRCDIIIVENETGEKHLMDTKIQHIVRNREDIMTYFLEEKQYTHLLFIDSDTYCPSDTIERLLFCCSDITTGAVPSFHQNNNELLIIPMLFFDENNGTVRSLTPQEVAGDRILHVDSGGFACTLIKRSVIEKIHKLRYNEKTQQGEDTLFMEDAKKEGFTIMARTGVKCIHEKYGKLLKLETEEEMKENNG